MWDEVRKGRDFLDGVVLSGGEPLLQLNEAENFIDGVVDMGVPVAVHTSGIPYRSLLDLVARRKINAIMLDYKAVPDRLGSVGIDEDEFLLSLCLCQNALAIGHIDSLEIRTTVFNGLNDSEEEIATIIRDIPDEAAYVLQQGRGELAKHPNDWMTVSTQRMLDLAKIARFTHPRTRVRALGVFERDLQPV
jgi:pyruvate formate lyase activating enzyme